MGILGAITSLVLLLYLGANLRSLLEWHLLATIYYYIYYITIQGDILLDLGDGLLN